MCKLHGRRTTHVLTISLLLMILYHTSHGGIPLCPDYGIEYIDANVLVSLVGTITVIVSYLD